MTLFSEQPDSQIRKPPMVEYFEIERQLKKELAAAFKSKDKERKRIATMNLADHLALRSEYMKAADNQLDIFDVEPKYRPGNHKSPFGIGG